MTQPNDKGVTLNPATSAESRMYEAILRAEAAEQERDKLKYILRFILAGPVTTKSEMRYVIMTACEEFVKLYPDELDRQEPESEIETDMGIQPQGLNKQSLKMAAAYLKEQMHGMFHGHNMEAKFKDGSRLVYYPPGADTDATE